MIIKHLSLMIFLVFLALSCDNITAKPKHISINNNIRVPDTITVKQTFTKEDVRPKSYFEIFGPSILLFLAALFSALITWLIGRNQRRITLEIFNKQLIDNKNRLKADFNIKIAIEMRQNWINTLREECACLISDLQQFEVQNILLVNEKKKAIKNQELINRTQENIYSLYGRLFKSRDKIYLYINPNKPHQLTLLNSMKKLFDYYNNMNFETDKFDYNLRNQLKDDFINSGRELFGFHWHKIKKSLEEFE